MRECHCEVELRIAEADLDHFYKGADHHALPVGEERLELVIELAGVLIQPVLDERLPVDEPAFEEPKLRPDHPVPIAPRAFPIGGSLVEPGSQQKQEHVLDRPLVVGRFLPPDSTLTEIGVPAFADILED